MPRPAHRPSDASRRQVEAMAGYGIPEADIARTIGIDPKTLRRHYRPELDLGRVKANSAVAQSLFRKATGDGPQSVTAAIFWARTRMRWKETSVTEHTGPGDGPLVVRLVRFGDLDDVDGIPPHPPRHLPSSGWDEA